MNIINTIRNLKKGTEYLELEDHAGIGFKYP
jgi:hypothetical protein